MTRPEPIDGAALAAGRDQNADRHTCPFSPDGGRSVPIQRIMMMTAQVRDFDGMVTWYRDVLGLEVLGMEPG
ncbi:MAG: hypothetical protein H0U89_02900, partial [Acidimicrobiia bacterium]|nr:hypothetical protein [Acidimicrobiia bacterium]